MYTDDPNLPRSLILGGFRLLFWLFFHPSAWRNYIVGLDLVLLPDFCLAELGREHWLKTRFLRLLFLLTFAWVIVTGSLLGVGVWLLQLPTQNALLGIVIGISVGFVVVIAVSVVGSVAMGTAVGLAAGIISGVSGGLFLGATLPSISLLSNVSPIFLLNVAIGLTGGLAGGLSYSVAMGVADRARNPTATHSLSRQLNGFLISVLIGVMAGFLTSKVSGQLVVGAAVGIPFGVAVYWRTSMWQRGIMGGLIVGATGSLLIGLVELGATQNIISFISLGALIASLFALPYVLADRFAGPGAGALAGALGTAGGLSAFFFSVEYFAPVLSFSMVGVLLGLTLTWWRPVILYPFVTAVNTLLYRLDERRLPENPHRPGLLRLHSAFWDEFQRLKLNGLDAHLLLTMVYNPAEAEAAMEYLNNGRQRWAVQLTQIELDARQLEHCTNVTAIGNLHRQLEAGQLAGPASALLRSFNRISQDVSAAQSQGSVYNQRLALNAVEDRLNGLIRELTRSAEPYAARFRPIAAEWRQIVATQGQFLATEAELRQEIDNPYIIGVPLTEQQEIFVGRADISARIEQLLLDRRQPPILLYGQRRVGKTSLLNNLGRLFPHAIIPLFVDLQGPASRAKNVTGFLYNISRSMIRSARRQRDFELPPLSREDLVDDPFTAFEEWLEDVEGVLGSNMALLVLDEFEALDTAFAKGDLDEDEILGMLRHLIQHRAHFKALLSGSHTLDEFHRWASYLINVQVVHIGYLSVAEAQQLIESPSDDFALRYEPAAVQRVIALTRGHPFLVQLLCAEIVALKNEQEPAVRRLATLTDVETAVSEALTHGSFFFADIQQNQVDAAGLSLLCHLAAQGEGAMLTEADAAIHEQALAGLRQRELIELVNGRYRFQVPMMQRWFAQL